MCDPATLITTAVSVGGTVMASKSAKKANDANIALAQQYQHLARDTQATNAGLINDQLGRNTELLTGARDQVTGLNTTTRDQVDAALRGTAGANAADLENQGRRNFELLGQTRDANLVT